MWSGMHQERDVRLLAYSISVKGVRAIELGSDYTREHDFGSSTKILSKCDELLGELRSSALLSLRELPALRRFASGWGRELLPEEWLTNPPSVGIMIPNGILHSLPFHLVSTGSGDPLCVASGFAKCSSLTLLL